RLPAWISVAVFACGVTPVCAGDVFEGLGPQLIGSELTVVLEGAELACRQDTADSSLRRCQPLPGALDTLGGAKVTSAEALFADDRLAMVSIYFSEREFAKVQMYAIQKLGEGQDW